MVQALFSLYAWLCLAVCVAVGLPVAAIVVAVLPHDRAFRVVGAIARVVLALLRIRIRLRGAEHLVPGQRYIVMGNHVSFMDIFFFAAAYPLAPVAVEKRENFRIPVYGWLVRRWGNIPVNRQDHEEAMKALAEARELLEGSDLSLVIMPEGTRSKSGKMGPFKRGGFHLAVQTGLFIAPFTFRGAFAVHPTGTWRFWPGDVEILLHPPVDPSGYGTERLDDLIAAVRTAIESGLDEPEPSRDAIAT